MADKIDINKMTEGQQRTFMALVMLNNLEVQQSFQKEFPMPDILMTPDLRARMAMAPRDTKPNAKGRFGYEKTNPILTNETMGQESYLSHLSYNGNRVAFIRLGSVPGAIDEFALVPMDYSRIDVVYIDMYHTFQSTVAPEGYEILKEIDGSTGTSECPGTFEHFIATVAESSAAHFGAPIVSKSLKDFDEKKADELLRQLG